MKQVFMTCLFMALSFIVGHQTKKCPKPPDPLPVIQEVEVIRQSDKPVIKEVEKRVEKIVKHPYYAGDCLDDDGLRALNDLVKGTAAGRKDPGAASGAAAQKR